ncbi:MAG: toll/interleukin-1 receptor domain-containing protein [Sulfuricurvum sp.]|jgi:hypothetical protein|uniref:toll/interleukin-1 receptor domain-containing protein n=1 Tax=Sulfuricurvum sp. TaxID=2025608 RepID=UPI0025EE0029|nr:toll/interleukin-1 receptor domain-containing protein [Sulfuricurvum sp.]MCK9373558.1 toll/interleukin-1 receptor domain-containing protein [Sulfuricurvum sp.]
MALFSYSELSRIPSNEAFDSSLNSTIIKNATSVSVHQNDKFDIFLSHSYSDKDIIPQLKKQLESLGYSVYVDWITDRFLSREQVNKATAEVLQKRMKQSKCLLFATSENSTNSKWMPWELGYFDGIKSKMVGILPLKKDNNGFNEDFRGQEYLGLYFYIDKAKISGGIKEALFVNENSKKYVRFDSWLMGNQPTQRN